jgi:nitroreductase
MTLYEAIEARRSVRAYRGTPIPKPVLQRIAESGAKAPSGMNEQNWVFVIVDDITVKDAIATASPSGKFIAQAGACIAVFNKTDGCAPVEDSAAATENIMLAAAAEGLGTCWVYSHETDHGKVIESLLGCPDGYEIVVLLAVGVPATETPKPEKKPMEEVIRWNGF